MLHQFYKLPFITFRYLLNVVLKKASVGLHRRTEGTMDGIDRTLIEVLTAVGSKEKLIFLMFTLRQRKTEFLQF